MSVSSFFCWLEFLHRIQNSTREIQIFPDWAQCFGLLWLRTWRVVLQGLFSYKSLFRDDDEVTASLEIL